MGGKASGDIDVDAKMKGDVDIDVKAKAPKVKGRC